MEARKLEQVTWYRDQESLNRGEPGIWHSYIASLATVMQTIGVKVDPAWLMGVSGFAFRLYIAQDMCPSCMSVFQWEKILPETLKQIEYKATYISRMWEEQDQEAQKQREAQDAILDGIKRGIPAIVWDIVIPEWGLIIGYDKNKQQYNVLFEDKRAILPFEKLGRNGIDILSVTILKSPRRDNRDEIILNSLKTAVAHAQQTEWLERPNYQDGLPAYDVWAKIMDSGATLTHAGKIQNVSPDIPKHILYHAAHHYSARCYAREYLRRITEGKPNLQKAADCYTQVADYLKPVYTTFESEQFPDEQTFRNLAQTIRDAKKAEAEGINTLREYLKEQSE